MPWTGLSPPAGRTGTPPGSAEQAVGEVAVGGEAREDRERGAADGGRPGVERVALVQAALQPGELAVDVGLERAEDQPRLAAPRQRVRRRVVEPAAQDPGATVGARVGQSQVGVGRDDQPATGVGRLEVGGVGLRGAPRGAPTARSRPTARSCSSRVRVSHRSRSIRIRRTTRVVPPANQSGVLVQTVGSNSGSSGREVRGAVHLAEQVAPVIGAWSASSPAPRARLLPAQPGERLGVQEQPAQGVGDAGVVGGGHDEQQVASGPRLLQAVMGEGRHRGQGRGSVVHQARSSRTGCFPTPR